eukprot:c11858_g1_i2.p1 GENE.c11858_g1_i2~~c11858_g1_i2.p1  ORF type:complete len:207 (+),score=52.19 c11858_g1_i2:24-623(+)
MKHFCLFVLFICFSSQVLCGDSPDGADEETLVTGKVKKGSDGKCYFVTTENGREIVYALGPSVFPEKCPQSCEAEKKSCSFVKGFLKTVLKVGVFVVVAVVAGKVIQHGVSTHKEEIAEGLASFIYAHRNDAPTPTSELVTEIGGLTVKKLVGKAAQDALNAIGEACCDALNPSNLPGFGFMVLEQLEYDITSLEVVMD